MNNGTPRMVHVRLPEAVYLRLWALRLATGVPVRTLVTRMVTEAMERKSSQEEADQNGR